MQTTSIDISVLQWLSSIIVSSNQNYLQQNCEDYDLIQSWLSLDKPREILNTLIRVIQEHGGSEGLYELLEEYGAGVIYNPAYWFIANSICSWEQDELTIDYKE